MGRIMQVVLPLLLVSVYNIVPTNAQAGNEDYYCGLDFFQVTEECALPCPSGEDSDCTNALGDEYACFFFTGCADKIANGFVPASLETNAPTSQPVEVAVETSAPIPAVVETDAPVTAAPTPEPSEVTIETSAPITAAPSSSPTQAEATQVTSSQPTTSISDQDQSSDTNADTTSGTPTAAPSPTVTSGAEVYVALTVSPVASPQPPDIEAKIDDPPSSNAAACEYLYEYGDAPPLSLHIMILMTKLPFTS